MICLESVTLREIRLPLRAAFRTSAATVHERRILLLTLRDRSGISVWAECVAQEHARYSPETVETASLILRTWLIPAVLNQVLPNPGVVKDILDREVRGHPMAKAALEMGMWGIGSELAGEPLARYLGGDRTSVETGISLGVQETPEAIAAMADRAVAEGYRRIKLKIAPGADVEFVDRVRSELAAEVPISVDANAAYRPEDFEVFRALDEKGLAMIEQPLERTDLLRHAALQARLKTPICLDESIDAPARAEDMIFLGSGRIVNIKPGRVGGLTASKVVHDRCEAAGIPVWCGGMLETGIGRAYNVALASLPNFSLPGDLSPSARYWTSDIVSPEWTMSPQGFVEVPRSRPGLGVEVDEDRVRSLTVWEETVPQ